MKKWADEITEDTINISKVFEVSDSYPRKVTHIKSVTPEALKYMFKNEGHFNIMIGTIGVLLWKQSE